MKSFTREQSQKRSGPKGRRGEMEGEEELVGEVEKEEKGKEEEEERFHVRVALGNSFGPGLTSSDSRAAGQLRPSPRGPRARGREADKRGQTGGPAPAPVRQLEGRFERRLWLFVNARY
ncbi:unnamed protein product [Boreogadus saida]